VSLEPEKLDDFRGAITSLDAALAGQHAVHIITLDSMQQLACDVTGNGAVTSLDAARISQLSVLTITRRRWRGCGSTGSCAGAGSAEPDTSHAASSADPSSGAITYDPLTASAANQDFPAILFDCTGNWAAQN
jgi:hypothetical protein